MKIAIFTDLYLEVPGGIPSSIAAQKESLKALGHEVTIFAPGFTTDDKDVVLVPTHKIIKINGAPVVKRPQVIEQFVEKEYPKLRGFDLVHVHYEASCSIAGMKLAKRHGLPLVQTMHGREDMAIAVNVPHPLKTIIGCVLCSLHGKYIPHPIKVRRDNSLANTIAKAKMWTLMINHANYADIVITPSEHFAKRLRKYGVKREIVPVSNGVADEMVRKLTIRAEKVGTSFVRKKADGDVLRIFWNSRLSKEKRIMEFMEALSLMKEPFFFSACGDGNALSEAKKFAEKHGLMGKVMFYGRVPHDVVLDKMLGQHISATVSYGFDTQGLTLLEAEATGLPVFFCDPDMRESAPDGGYVMAGGPSPREMAKALDKLAREPKKIEQMSRVMLEHRKEIMQSTQIKRLLDVYKNALDSR